MNIKTAVFVITLALANSVCFTSFAQQPTETKSCSSCGNSSCCGCKK